MKQRIERETLYIIHDDHQEVMIPIQVDVIYSELDDGFFTVEPQMETLDFVCQGRC